MADTHSVTLDIPDSIGVTLRGFARKIDTTKLPLNVIVALFEKGVQRGSNDPLGALFDKGEKVAESKINEYFADLTKRWYAGEVAKTRAGGLGRTTDPVQREIKRLASAEVDRSRDAEGSKLLAHHGVNGVPMTKKAFDETLRAKYIAGQIEKHRERLEREAKANLAKLQRSADVDLLDIDADEPATSEDETETTEA